MQQETDSQSERQETAVKVKLMQSEQSRNNEKKRKKREEGDNV
jgi:hypothetical protein